MEVLVVVIVVIVVVVVVVVVVAQMAISWMMRFSVDVPNLFKRFITLTPSLRWWWWRWPSVG